MHACDCYKWKQTAKLQPTQFQVVNVTHLLYSLYQASENLSGQILIFTSKRYANIDGKYRKMTFLCVRNLCEFVKFVIYAF